MGNAFPDKYEWKIIKRLKKMGVIISENLCRSKLDNLMKYHNIKMRRSQ